MVAADFGLTAEDFYPFFQEKWTDIAAGLIAIELALAEAFTAIGVTVDVEDFLRRGSNWRGIVESFLV